MQHTLTDEQLWGLVFEAAGAATAPFMRDNPDTVMPSEEVADGVRNVMAEHGFTEPPAGYRAEPPAQTIAPQGIDSDEGFGRV